MKLFIKNLDPLNGKEVKIYQVSADGSLVVPPDFSPLDALGRSVGIKLTPGYDVLSTNAINHQGIVEADIPLTGNGEVQIINGKDVNLKATTNSAILDGLRALGLSITELTEYVPTETGDFTCIGPNAGVSMGFIDIPVNGALDVYYNDIKLNPEPANGRDVQLLLEEKHIKADFYPIVNNYRRMVLTNLSLTDDCHVRIATNPVTPDQPVGLPEVKGSIEILNAGTSTATVKGCMTLCSIVPGIDSDKISSSITFNSTTPGATQETTMSLNCAVLETDDIPEATQSSIPLYGELDFVKARMSITSSTNGEGNISYKFENISDTTLYIALGPAGDPTNWVLTPAQDTPTGAFVIKDNVIYFLLKAKD